MIKTKLIKQILEHLQQKLASSELAATNAHLAAIDDQSVAETQYDTLAIESAYLAEGQSRRIEECKIAINKIEQFKLQLENIDEMANSPVKLGSLVQLEKDEDRQHWFFVAPAAGGFKYDDNKRQYTVITPQSPMGVALLHKQLDDDIEVLIGNNKLADYIIAVK